MGNPSEQDAADALTAHLVAWAQVAVHYLLRLKTRWRDGTTQQRLEPIELMERLAAQIPKPRINQVLYAGVLAPNAPTPSSAPKPSRTDAPHP